MATCDHRGYLVMAKKCLVIILLVVPFLLGMNYIYAAETNETESDHGIIDEGI